MADKTLDFLNKFRANEAIKVEPLDEVADDKNVHQTLEKNKLPITTQTSLTEEDEDGGEHDMVNLAAYPPAKSKNLDSGNRINGASSGFGGHVSNNTTTNTIMMPADKTAKSHTSNEITTQKSLFSYDDDTGHTEVLASATDSGYASLPTHDYKRAVQNNEMNENQQSHSNESDTNYTNILGNEDQSIDDTYSVYTAGPDIPPSKKDAYISLLADDLLNKALTEKPDEESLDRVCEALPRYLKTFAIKVGSSDSASICRDVMVFVRRYRRLAGMLSQLPLPGANYINT